MTQDSRCGRWPLLALAILLLAAASCDRSTPTPSPSQAQDQAVLAKDPPSRATQSLVQSVLAKDPRDVDPDWIDLHFEFSADAPSALLDTADPERFESRLRSHFRARPDVGGLPTGFIRNRRDTATFYDQGQLKIRTFEPVPFELPVDWAPSDQSLTFVAELHSWRFINDLVVAHQETGNSEYLRAAESVILDWIEQNPHQAPAHRRAWHEGAVAKRIMVLLNLFNYYKNAERDSAIGLSMLLALVVQHAEYLAGGEHYRPGGNHGIRQDIGLIAAALALPEARRSKTWMRIGLQRLLEEQVKVGFSREGVWREHSPTYHHYVMQRLDELVTLIDQNEFDEDIDFLKKLTEQSRRYMTHVLTPAGRFPPVGDSDEQQPRISRSVDCPSVRYVLSGGAEGERPLDLDGLFPDAGEVVFRDTWGDELRRASDALYINMHAAFHPGFGHRHADDLSFVMFGHGRWWILEAGKYGYEKDRWRAFIESAQAHNGYTLDGAALRPLDGGDPSKDAFFEEHIVSTDDLAAARAHTNRFPQDGVSVTRTFIFLRDRRTLVLLDHLTSPEPGAWRGYLHLPPDMVTSQPDPTTVLGSVESHPEIALEIVTEVEKTIAVDIALGREEPLLGWHSPSFLEMIPAPTVTLDRQGKDLIVATIIRIRDLDALPIREVSSERNEDSDTVAWREGAERFQIDVSRVAPLAVEWVD